LTPSPISAKPVKKKKSAWNQTPVKKSRVNPYEKMNAPIVKYSREVIHKNDPVPFDLSLLDPPPTPIISAERKALYYYLPEVIKQILM